MEYRNFDGAKNLMPYITVVCSEGINPYPFLVCVGGCGGRYGDA